MKKKETKGEYFIISPGEDGARVEQMDKEELLKRITRSEEEDTTDYGDVDFLEKIEETDPNYWGDNILIIKGEIVKPKAVKVVTKLEIE